MQKSMLAVIFVTVGFLLLAAFAQEGTEPKPPATVPEILTRAGASYAAGRYSTCMSEIREANQVVMAERSQWIRVALPDAPDGLEKRSPQDLSGAGLATSAAELMASSTGMLVTQDYRGKIKSIRVTVMVDSPFLQKQGWDQALSKHFENDSKRIQFGKHKGILVDEGSGNLDLELLIESSMVRVATTGLTRDEVLAFLDQKAVDVLAAALAK